MYYLVTAKYVSMSNFLLANYKSKDQMQYVATGRLVHFLYFVVYSSILAVVFSQLKYEYRSRFFY